MLAGILALAFWLATGPAGRGADLLVWREGDNRVDARFQGWKLDQLLEQIAAATGWQIYLEPGSDYTASANFKNLKVSDALRHLLGNLNYALLPQTDAPPKLFVYHTSLQDATVLIRPPARNRALARTGTPIADELVVILKPDARETIEQLARRLGARVVGRIDGLEAYRLRFESETAAAAAREQLRHDPTLTVDSNFLMERPTWTENLMFSSGPSYRLRPMKTGDGSRLVVGLIDTAVQSVAPELEALVLPALSVAGEAPPPGPRPTHGTAMLDTILQGLALAQDGNSGTPVRILPVDVYGLGPSTSSFDVANGIYTAINGGATLINLSMGSEGDSLLLRQVIEQGREQGVAFIGAAGNEPGTNPVYPAAYPEVIAVTAGDKRGNIAPYANHGSFVDLIAPGTSVVHFQGQAYLVSGTSAATAYISGMAAGMSAVTGRSLAEVEQRLRESLGVDAAGRSNPKP